ncbi:MAG TPA: alpha/beta hydrolase [Chryseosolibacter sp.]
MKIVYTALICVLGVSLQAQIPGHLKDAFPEGTTTHQNVSYAGDTLRKHQLDIYLPTGSSSRLSLIVWVHGGAWNHNDKYADMGYMTQTIKGLLENGYAFASIDYRHSTTRVFPAQVQDCSQALQFLYDNADKYRIDKNRIALIGFSAGGHLASILGLSLNNDVKDFYPPSGKPSYTVKAVVDFYGPADLLMMSAKQDPEITTDPIYQLLGAAAVKRPDLARRASPVTYVDKNDPPFFIVNGEKDESVPFQQSLLLKSMLDLAGVKNELIIVKGAPHYGKMFDAEDVRRKLYQFLKTNLQ